MRFTYWGTELEGFCHLYNLTFLTERTVELAVVGDWLSRVGGQGLEVGNVLGHYNVSGHRIADRYEPSAWYQPPDAVANIDVFDIAGPVDWIVSISTLEHVGYDFPPWDETASVRAVAHLRSLLEPGGKMILTMPTGFNPGLDVAIADGTLGADRACTLRRDGPEEWYQTAEIEVLPYGLTTRWAESVWIGEFTAVDAPTSVDVAPG